MEATTAIICPVCGSSKVFKDGYRSAPLNANSSEPLQRYRCANQECKHRFSQQVILNTIHNYTQYYQISANLGAKNLDTATELKTVVGDKQGSIVDFAWKLKKQNLNDGTIEKRLYYLEQLVKKGADLSNPDSIETILATEKFTAAQKLSYVRAYSSYTKINKIVWTPIKVKYQPKEPFMPTREEMLTLINGSGKITATFLQVTMDTGARRGEVCKIKWTDVNVENKTISINQAEKGSRNRTLKVTEKTIAMIQSMPRKYDPYIFNPNVDAIKKSFADARSKLAKIQQNPRLKQIHLHTFRHFFASELLRKNGGNLPQVRDALGHKSITNTERYTRTVVFADNQKYDSATATTEQEIRHLIEDGWTFVCQNDNIQYFKKAKN